MNEKKKINKWMRKKLNEPGRVNKCKWMSSMTVQSTKSKWMNA